MIRAEGLPDPRPRHRRRAAPNGRAGVASWGAGSAPDAATMEEALPRPGDVWHAGIRLGMGGLPTTLDFVAPNWMLNCDPSPAIEATSWRLRWSCLVRTEVLAPPGRRETGKFTSPLAAAGLELGHRWIMPGALMRHAPGCSRRSSRRAGAPLEDASGSSTTASGRSGCDGASCARCSRTEPVCGKRAARFRLERERCRRRRLLARGSTPALRTRGRFGESHRSHPDSRPLSYLEKLLANLQGQTVRPLEIVVVDQTPPSGAARTSRRPYDLRCACFISIAGPCSSRNTGLDAALGDYVVFGRRRRGRART